jgi:hypothetical protein
MGDEPAKSGLLRCKKLMTSRPRQSNFLAVDELSDLRQMLAYIRSDLKVPRQDIADGAGVEAVSIDNFLSKKGKNQFKSQIPSGRFQRRILKYILDNDYFSSPEYNADDVAASNTNSPIG